MCFGLLCLMPMMTGHGRVPGVFFSVEPVEDV